MSARRTAPRRLQTAVAAVACAAVLLLTSAVPAHAATEVSRDKLSGLVVEADTFSVSEDGCVVTGSNLQADRKTIRYSTFAFNECTFEQIHFAFGEGTPTVFEVDRKLSSAHLVAEVALLDPVTGEPTGDVADLHVTWTAVGPATKERVTSSESVPGEFKFTFRSVGTFRTATVEGLGDGEAFGRIGRASIMFMSLVRDGAAPLF